MFEIELDPIEINKIKNAILASNPSKTYFINDVEYTQTDEEFEDAVQKRAEMQYRQQIQIAKQNESKAAAEAKLAAFGLTADDLKALGL